MAGLAASSHWTPSSTQKASFTPFSTSPPQETPRLAAPSRIPIAAEPPPRTPLVEPSHLAGQTSPASHEKPRNAERERRNPSGNRPKVHLTEKRRTPTVRDRGRRKPPPSVARTAGGTRKPPWPPAPPTKRAARGVEEVRGGRGRGRGSRVPPSESTRRKNRGPGRGPKASGQGSKGVVAEPSLGGQ